jgi:hypothetical protein
MRLEWMTQPFHLEEMITVIQQEPPMNAHSMNHTPLVNPIWLCCPVLTTMPDARMSASLSPFYARVHLNCADPTTSDTSEVMCRIGGQ